MPYNESTKWNFVVDSLHTVGTNAGSLEGPPPIENTMKAVERDAKQYFFDWPFVIVPPKITEHHIKHPVPEMRVLKILPRWTHYALFHGPEIHDKDAHGSILGVIWFDDELLPKSAERDILLQVDWDKHAKDFWY